MRAGRRRTVPADSDSFTRADFKFRRRSTGPARPSVTVLVRPTQSVKDDDSDFRNRTQSRLFQSGVPVFHCYCQTISVSRSHAPVPSHRLFKTSCYFHGPSQCSSFSSSRSQDCGPRPGCLQTLTTFSDGLGALSDGLGALSHSRPHRPLSTGSVMLARIIRDCPLKRTSRRPGGARGLPRRCRADSDGSSPPLYSPPRLARAPRSTREPKRRSALRPADAPSEPRTSVSTAAPPAPAPRLRPFGGLPNPPPPPSLTSTVGL